MGRSVWGGSRSDVYGTEGQRQWSPSRHVAESVTRTTFTSGLTYGGGSFGGIITDAGRASLVKPGPGGMSPDPSGGEQQATDPGSQQRKERGGFFRV